MDCTYCTICYTARIAIESVLLGLSVILALEGELELRAC
jgi:hypothetical protein